MFILREAITATKPSPIITNEAIPMKRLSGGAPVLGSAESDVVGDEVWAGVGDEVWAGVGDEVWAGAETVRVPGA